MSMNSHKLKFWKAFGEARVTKSDLWREFGGNQFPGFAKPELMAELQNKSKMFAECILEKLMILGDRTKTSADENEDKEGLNAIRLIGLTADFFGGFDGMTRLHNAFEKSGGNTYKMNRFWDQIGTWCS